MNKRISLIASLMASVSILCSAQGYYDDDIYFDSSKDKDKNKELAKQQAAAKSRTNGYVIQRVADYPSADTYSYSGTSTRSVDDYNRRGMFARDSIANDSAQSATDFAYTRQIERYYNPSVVAGQNDRELEELYYATPANVNIIINSPGYWGYYPGYWGGWYDPWFGPSHWWGYYGPNWWWGSGWGWSYPGWGWGPSWAWGGPIYAPGWGWSWGWGPSWGGSWRPEMSHRHPGATRHPRGVSPSYGNHNYGGWRPAYNSGNRHNGNASSYPAYRPGSQGSNGYRPSYNSNGNNNDGKNYVRPGRRNSNSDNPVWRSNNSGGGNRGGVYNGGSRGGGGGNRGRH